MLMFIILVIVIGLFLFIFFAKKTDSTQDTSDFSHPYPSTSSSCDSFQDNDDKGIDSIDNCSSNAESNSDSSSCDSNSNND